MARRMSLFGRGGLFMRPRRRAERINLLADHFGYGAFPEAGMSGENRERTFRDRKRDSQGTGLDDSHQKILP